MIARCARCQGTFTTDRFGRQTCPHCGAELILADPNAPAPPPSGAPEQGAPPPAPPSQPAASAGGLPPAPPPPPGGYGPQGGAPPGGFGPPPGGGWAGPPGGGWGGPPPGPGPDVPSPFAERATRGFFPTFFETWKLVATQPAEFFRRVRIDQTGSALLFGVIAATVGTVAAALYQWLQLASGFTGFGRVWQMGGDEARMFDQYRAFFPGVVIAAIVLAPVATFLSTYVVAAILHLLLMLFRGANRPFDATLTVVAYANALQLLNVVPGCGGLIAAVWGLVVLVIGLGETQRCGSGKAAAAVFAPAILVCVCACGALALSAPALMKLIEGATQQGTTVNL